MLALCVVAVWLGATPARGQEERPPEGIPVGSWVLTPSFVVGYARDSNVFYSSEGFGPGPQSDNLTRVQPSLRATLPFRNSRLRLAYEASWLDYGATQLDRKWSQELSGELSLLFSSFDRLTLKASRTMGLQETLQFDPGGEVVFRGSAYDLDILSAELKREVRGRRGYRLYVARSDLSFPPSTKVNFFEFRGFDGRAEYLEPLSQRLWVTSVYESRRYEHFLSNPRSGRSAPFRREKSDDVWTGFRGLLGEGSSFGILVGRAVGQYPGGAGSDFRGLIFDGQLNLHIGGGSRLAVTASRTAWPSFFFANNYQLSDAVGLRFERSWRRASTLGFSLTAARGRYPDQVPSPRPGGAGILRKDDSWSGETYATLVLHPRFGFRLSVSHQGRNSTFEPAEYRKTVFFGGVSLGWF